ncbi:MAG: hypothetical protein KGI83_02625 [Verrucomicrobiota bacterium]|nr:hypothetical protein [Verrucomicrobiota bacterium]
MAKRLDFGSGACLPLGYVDEMDSDQFFSVEAAKTGQPAGVQRKEVYVQQFIENTTPLVELHPDCSQDLDKAYQIAGHPVLDQVPLEEFQKIALLDLLLYNEDRHAGNLVIFRDAIGVPHLIPIDMDMILPGTFQQAPRTGLFTHRRAEERLTPDTLAWIEALNPEQVASVVREEGLAEPLARQAKMLALVLKELGPDHSIAEMSQFIFSKLARLVDLSRANALQALTPSDRESYQKSEVLRKGLWENKNSLQNAETWYETYKAESKQRIETLLEEKTFDSFQRGLEREAAALRARKTRDITFGTTYIAGNADRDALSKLVSDNQQEYAQHWGLHGKVVTESLLQGQCQGATGSVDCVPYWNKVAILRTWLQQPSSGKEEWYVLADDDMPITNMNINPYQAIDLLREGDDASIIIARDVVQWTGGRRDHSVNTGVLMVRKDQNSKDFIEKLWAKRNDAATQSSHCRTLGTCKTQDVLHEQEAFARVLAEDPSLLNKVVKVVNYRNTYRGREIALNTFRRHGCFVRVQDGWSDRSFSYNDPADGAWREGDWMGQTAGVPIKGRECSTGEPRSFRLDYLRSMLERIIPIDAEGSSLHTSQPISAAQDTVTQSLAYEDRELWHEIETTLGKRNYPEPTNKCKPNVCSWPKDYEAHVESTLAKMEGADAKKHARLAINWAWAHYILEEGMGNEGKPYLAKITDPAIQDTARGYIDHVIRREVDSLGHQRKFEEATQRVSDIHSTAVQAEAIGSIAEHRLAYDQELLQEIQTTLGKRNYHEPTNKCKPQICSWPKDYEAHVESTLAKITDADTKLKAQRAIGEAWAQYILEEGMGNEAKPYLSKIADAAIQDKARGHIDQAILRQVASLGQQRKFEEATKRVSDIHSAAVKAEAVGSLAEHRLAYDQELLQEIQTTLGRRNYHEPTNKCTPHVCSWPKDYEAHVDSTLAKITDADTKLKAQRAIGEAWVQYILDRNLERDKALANIADPSIRTIARKGLEKMVLETVKTLIQEKKFDEAGKVVSQIQTPSIRKQAEDSLDAGLLKRIKHILTKTKSNPQYDASKNADCRGCYWPEDFEQAIEKLISQISNTDVQAQARKSIAQAWAQHIHK